MERRQSKDAATRADRINNSKVTNVQIVSFLLLLLLLKEVRSATLGESD